MNKNQDAMRSTRMDHVSQLTGGFILAQDGRGGNLEKDQGSRAVLQSE